MNLETADPPSPSEGDSSLVVSAAPASEVWPQDLLAALPGVVYQFRRDAEGTFSFSYLSDGIFDFLGVTATEAMQEAALVFDCVLPEHLPELHRTLHESQTQMTPWRTNYAVKARDGRQHWLQSHSLPKLQEDGSTLWNGFVIDITDQKRAEAELSAAREELEVQVHERTSELREKEERLRSVVQGIPIILFALDEHGVFTLSDGKGLLELGLKPGEVAGKSVFDLFGENAGIKEDVHRCLTGETFSSLRTVGGLSFETLYTPTLDEHGVPQGLVGVSTNVTEKIEGLHALMRAKTEAEEANNAKSRFLAKMSHELRTPLNVILGFAELLNDQAFGELNSKQQRYTTNILSSGKQLLQLINDILDLSRIETAPMHLDYTLFDVQDAIRDVVALSKPYLKEKKQTIELDLSPQTLFFRADEAKFKQIIDHLLNNSIKFTSEGENILLKSKCCSNLDADEFVEITVTDNGLGMTPERAAALSEERTENASSPFVEEAGRGLLLVRHLVKLHGGQFSISSLGKSLGTTVVVKFPRL